MMSVHAENDFDRDENNGREKVCWRHKIRYSADGALALGTVKQPPHSRAIIIFRYHGYHASILTLLTYKYTLVYLIGPLHVTTNANASKHALSKSLSEADTLEILFQGSFYSAQAFMEVYFGCPNNCRSIEGRCDNFSHLLYACVIVVRAIELSQLKAFRHDKSCIQFTIMFLASEFSTPLLLNNVTQKNPPFHSIVGPLLVMFS